VVYDPQGDATKLEFLQEIKQINLRAYSKWLILGDFNLICRASDKNTGWVNRRLMSSFSHILDELELKELHLQGQRFTWTSATSNPTQTKIDHVFSTREWELQHPHYHLQVLGSSVSDHCPMILTCTPFHQRYKGFRFQAWWTHMPGFMDTVKHSWEAPVNSINKAWVLHIKLARLGKALNKWSKERIGTLKQGSYSCISDCVTFRTRTGLTVTHR
jgi:hypothetical protein